MTNPPKKPSEIIRERATSEWDEVRPQHWSSSTPPDCMLLEAVLEFLDSQADAYTTGYNQAIADVNAKLAE